LAACDDAGEVLEERRLLGLAADGPV